MMSKWSNILLGVWLALSGANALFDFRIAAGSTLLSMLALVTGIIILTDDRTLRWNKKTGRMLLAIWLIGGALLSLTSLHIAHSDAALAVLALAAGIIILLGR